MKVNESVGVLGLVVLLPLTVAAFADTNTTFAFGVSAVAPYIDSVVN